MLRTTVAAGVVACALAAASPAEAQGFRLNIGVGPSYGNYGPNYGYSSGRFYDQRYYGDWRDYRGRYHYRQPHLHYHGYPFPHYDLHWGRHHGHRHYDHGHHHHRRHHHH